MIFLIHVVGENYTFNNIVNTKEAIVSTNSLKKNINSSLYFFIVL